MKRFASPLFILLCFATVVSCQKVVDLEITDSEKKVVIEAELREGTHLFEVLVSQSSYYNETSVDSQLNNATVRLEDDLGQSIVIPLAGNGSYQAIITAAVGRTYTLFVEIDEKTYTAQSKMPSAVSIQNLSASYVDATLNGSSGYRVKCDFTDVAGQPDFYRIRHSADQVIQNDPNDLVVFNDDLKDGLLFSKVVTRRLYDSGQTIQVELIHIDEPSYNYLYSLGDILGSSPTGGSAAPSNPVTTWSDGAMGVFSAYNIDTMTIVIP